MSRVSLDYDAQFQAAVQTLREVFGRRNQELLSELSAAKQTIQQQQMELRGKDHEIEALLTRIAELEQVSKEKSAEIQALSQERSQLQNEVAMWKSQSEQLAEFKHAITSLVDPTPVPHASPLPSASASAKAGVTLPRTRSRALQSLSAMLDDPDM